MSTHRAIVPAVGLALCLVARAGARRGPGLGKPLTEADIAAWDISIDPDGKGLPPGGGTPPKAPHLRAKNAPSATVRRARAGSPGSPPRTAAIGRRRPYHRHLGGDEADRQFLAVLDDPVRLHSPRDAVAAADDTRRTTRSTR